MSSTTTTSAAIDFSWYDLTCSQNFDQIRTAIRTHGPPSPDEMWSCIECALTVNAGHAADIVKSARFFFPLVDSCGSEYATKVAKLGAPTLKKEAKQGLAHYKNANEKEEVERIIIDWFALYRQ